VRAFGLPRVTAAGLTEGFPELRGLPGCRFGDCVHRTEPGCAVRAAVAEGRFARERYEAYLRLLDELTRDALADEGSRGRF